MLKSFHISSHTHTHITRPSKTRVYKHEQFGSKKRHEDASTCHKTFSSCTGMTKAQVHTDQGGQTFLTKGHSCIVGWLPDRTCKNERTTVTNPLSSCVHTVYIYAYIYIYIIYKRGRGPHKTSWRPRVGTSDADGHNRRNT